MIVRLIFITSLLLVSGACTLAQDISGIGKSHIDANVPDEKDFDAILKRDMTAYVTDRSDKEIAVGVELLRNAPTQSGVALPKFYVWIVKRDAQGVVMEEAAARIAAIEKKKFEVIQYYEKKRIVAEPDLMKKVFPADVYEKILSKVNASGK